MCIFSLQLDFISPFLQYVFGVFFFFFPFSLGVQKPDIRALSVCIYSLPETDT